ncbi:MAG TPA: acylphosphatase [Actinomycetota bacterium]|nr:acylphosphatase [Actinomycetota bacterium]
MIARRIVVSGRVQGVFFRDTCRRVAEQLGVAGSATNLPDGRVEVVAEGDAAAVDALEKWCREGTDLSSVASVETYEEDPSGASSFSVR